MKTSLALIVCCLLIAVYSAPSYSPEQQDAIVSKIRSGVLEQVEKDKGSVDQMDIDELTSRDEILRLLENLEHNENKKEEEVIDEIVGKIVDTLKWRKEFGGLNPETEQSTPRTKQYWDYNIPKRVKYATGNYFKTFKDDPHHDDLSEEEIEAIYAAAIQFVELTVPVRKNEAKFEAIQMLGIMVFVVEYKSSPAYLEAVRNRDLEIFGLRVDTLLRTLFSNLGSDLLDEHLEMYYYYLDFSSLRYFFNCQML